MKYFSIALILTFVCRPAAAQEGGPPMLTDDARVTEYREWEINLSLNPTVTNRFTLALPYVDLNYGIAPNLQLKAEAPYLLHVHEGTATGTLGDIALGVKLRFLDEEKYFVSAATFPQVTVRGENGVLLPVFVEKTIGRILIGQGLGYFRGINRSNRLQWGSVAGVRAAKDLDFMLEYFLLKDYATALTNSGYLNLGFRYTLNKTFGLMASFGSQVLTPADHQREYLIGWVGLRTEF